MLTKNEDIFLLSICTENRISSPNIITFLTTPLPFDNKIPPSASNPVPYPKYSYLSGSAFFVNLAAEKRIS